MDTAGHHKRQIWAGGETTNVGSVAWSPDGYWIAFGLTVEKGGGNAESGVWLIRPDGRNMHRVASGAEPTWSPDGRWIAFSRTARSTKSEYATALEMVRTDGTGRLRLTRPKPDTRLEPDWCLHDC